tara:strand:- start:6187 stop:6534 length:348 start_codon:yes stop_codon:yes gene_type:complete
MPAPKKKPAAPKKSSGVRKTAKVTVKDDPVKDISNAQPVRRPGRPPKVQQPKAPEYKMIVVTPSDRLELKFDDQLAYNNAYQQIAFKCGSNRFAVVQSQGKEYTFCNVEYIVRDA